MTIGPDSKILESWIDSKNRTYSIRTCSFPAGVFAQIETSAGEVVGMSDSYKTTTGAKRWARRSQAGWV